MSSSPATEHQYSTLEVASHADAVRQGTYPEVAPHADTVRQGTYPEVVPHSAPEAYGYYEPAKATPNALNGPLIPPKAEPQYSYSTYPEVAGSDSSTNPPLKGSKKATICGIPRKFFWIAVAGLVLIIVGVVVGVVVGTRPHDSAGSKDTQGDKNDGNGNGSPATNRTGPANSVEAAGLSLFEDTKLATANFTDAAGNENFLLVYQMSDASICLSAFNTSNDKWVVSTVVNGTTEGVKLGTPLSINTFWRGAESPDVNLYYLGNGSDATLKSMTYSSSNEISTLETTPPNKWDPVASTSSFNSAPGTSLVSYGKQCDFCNQYGYLFWEGSQGLFRIEDKGDGVMNAEVVQIDAARLPSVNTSIALAHSGTLVADSGAITRRSLNLFYRSRTSGLTQLRIGNGMNIPIYVGRDIGPRTMFAAFSTGFNESDPEKNPVSPIGFQVLSIDPDASADEGVQLTYLKDGEWNMVSDGIDALADCLPRATMVANTGQRLYCLVESSDASAGVEIVEWLWEGKPSDTGSYSEWRRIGAVDVAADE